MLFPRNEVLPWFNNIVSCSNGRFQPQRTRSMRQGLRPLTLDGPESYLCTVQALKLPIMRLVWYIGSFSADVAFHCPHNVDG